MNLRTVPKEILLKRTEELAAKERHVTLEVLHHLREIERRMLYAELGHSSLKVYCVKVLRYSETAAGRRISSMRLLKDLPEIETKIASGELTLSNAAQAQVHFRKMKAETRKDASKEEKKAVLE